MDEETSREVQKLRDVYEMGFISESEFKSRLAALTGGAVDDVKPDSHVNTNQFSFDDQTPQTHSFNGFDDTPSTTFNNSFDIPSQPITTFDISSQNNSFEFPPQNNNSFDFPSQTDTTFDFPSQTTNTFDDTSTTFDIPVVTDEIPINQNDISAVYDHDPSTTSNQYPTTTYGVPAATNNDINIDHVPLKVPEPFEPPVVLINAMARPDGAGKEPVANDVVKYTGFFGEGTHDNRKGVAYAPCDKEIHIKRVPIDPTIRSSSPEDNELRPTYRLGDSEGDVTIYFKDRNGVFQMNVDRTIRSWSDVVRALNMPKYADFCLLPTRDPKDTKPHQPKYDPYEYSNPTPKPKYDPIPKGALAVRSDEDFKKIKAGHYVVRVVHHVVPRSAWNLNTSIEVRAKAIDVAGVYSLATEKLKPERSADLVLYFTELRNRRRGELRKVTIDRTNQSWSYVLGLFEKSERSDFYLTRIDPLKDHKIPETNEYETVNVGRSSSVKETEIRVNDATDFSKLKSGHYRIRSRRHIRHRGRWTIHANRSLEALTTDFRYQNKLIYPYDMHSFESLRGRKDQYRISDLPPSTRPHFKGYLTFILSLRLHEQKFAKSSVLTHYGFVFQNLQKCVADSLCYICGNATNGSSFLCESHGNQELQRMYNDFPKDFFVQLDKELQKRFQIVAHTFETQQNEDPIAKEAVERENKAYDPVSRDYVAAETINRPREKFRYFDEKVAKLNQRLKVWDLCKDLFS